MPVALKSLAPLALLLLAGCAVKQVRTMEPELAVAPDRCEASVRLETATPIVVGDIETPENEVLFDINSPCVRTAEGSAVHYHVFRLPPATPPYLLTIRTEPVGPAYLVPSATFLAADGRPVQTISPDSFIFHGTSLAALFRGHAGEDYLVVQSDPLRVGMAFDQIAEAHSLVTLTQTINKGAVVSSSYEVAHSMNHHFVFSHNGSLHVTARLIPAE